MNSLERIQGAINFEPVDRLPVIAQVFGHTALMAGATIHDYVRNGRVVAECQLKALARYDYDAVFAVMDVGVETEALGSKLTYRSDDYPYVRSYAFSKETNLEALSLPNPLKAGRMPEILEALTTLRHEVKEEVLVVGCILGPMTLTTQLLGLETALYLAIDDPGSFEKFLDFSTRTAIQFGIAQIDSGAHLPLVFDPAASQAVIPPQFFREFELPRLKKLFAALKAAGALANWFHAAGPIDSILPFYPESGTNLINFDYCVDPEIIQKKVPSLCVNGNIKSLDFEEAEPEKIGAAAFRLKERFSERGGFILSSGCEIPPRSKPENIAALVSATRRQG
ncbi:MAG: uroporphyrinogen decarboxylase family protein [Deltaproteobacteria bacterium]|nr:uroporphyrinogen decarboxylase family protein [Deltaproteobacteria bacterium]